MEIYKNNTYKFEFPENLLAKYPLKERDKARLMIVDSKKHKIYHKLISDLPEYFGQDDLLVLNNTKVIPARLLGRKLPGGGKIEVFLIQPIPLNSKNIDTWKVLLKMNKKVKKGIKIQFSNSLTAEVVDINIDANTSTSIHKLKFSKTGKELMQDFQEIGKTPLPPYIKRETEKNDKYTYQTVFAKYPGAVAAPTAGLHFTDTVLSKIKEKMSRIIYITLHVGPGTFLPVEAEDIRDHRIHSEEYFIENKDYDILLAHQNAKKPITAVGTTSLRTIETIASNKHKAGTSSLYIYPGYKFLSTNRLLTNFHLPQSSLFILVSAFTGDIDFMKFCYKEAFKEKYRLFSYGDAMLIL